MEHDGRDGHAGDGIPIRIPGVITHLCQHEDASYPLTIEGLRQMYKRDDGSVGYRCPAEPVDQYIHKGGTLEDTADPVCLCNGLMTTAGLGGVQKNRAPEPALVTAGDDISGLHRYFRPGADDYSADDVLDVLLKERTC